VSIRIHPRSTTCTLLLGLFSPAVTGSCSRPASRVIMYKLRAFVPGDGLFGQASFPDVHREFPATTAFHRRAGASSRPFPAAGSRLAVPSSRYPRLTERNWGNRGGGEEIAPASHCTFYFRRRTRGFYLSRSFCAPSCSISFVRRAKARARESLRETPSPPPSALSRDKAAAGDHEILSFGG